MSILAASSLRDPIALDSFWHLKTGTDWIEKDLSPFTDHYSITHYGETIGAQPVAFQVVLYSFVKLFGLDGGYILLVFVAGALVIGLYFLWLKQIKAPVLVVCATAPLLLPFLQLRAMIRPEIFDYSFLLLALLLYERARKGMSRSHAICISALMITWVNYHPIVLGYVVFGGLILDLAIKLWTERAPPSKWTELGLWSLLIFLTGFMHHGFMHPVLDLLTFTSEWSAVIDEYKPSLLGTVHAATLLLLCVSAFTMVALVKLRQAGYFLVCLTFTVAAIQMVRMVTPSGIVVVSLFALSLSNTKAVQWMNRTDRWQSQALGLSLLILMLSAFTLSVVTAQKLIRSNQNLVGNFPDQLVQYLETKDVRGRIFNEYEIGGYLIYHTGDSHRVYIDGRTGILYPAQHVYRWQAAMNSPQHLAAEIETHQINQLVLRNTREKLDLASSIDSMALDFVDLRYSLYTTDSEANFPYSGEIWGAPWCWNEKLAEKVALESSLAHRILPEYAPLVHLITLSQQFDSAHSRESFLTELWSDREGEDYDDNLRFAGYRSIELGLYDLARKWFYSVKSKTLKDYLAGSFANLKADETKQAREILTLATQREWAWITKSEMDVFDHLKKAVTRVRSASDPSAIEIEHSSDSSPGKVPAFTSRFFASAYCRQ